MSSGQMGEVFDLALDRIGRRVPALTSATPVVGEHLSP
jgi:hypothetical protein